MKSIVEHNTIVDDSTGEDLLTYERETTTNAPLKNIFKFRYGWTLSKYHALSHTLPLLSIASPLAGQQFVSKWEFAYPLIEGALWQAWRLLALL
jgi:hypothetical protein